MTTENSKLQLLREKAGIIDGPLESELGKTWYPRCLRSKAYLEAHSADWDELRSFFAKPYADVEVKLPDGGTTTIKIKLSIMWSMGKNHVSDLHFRNPEPWIRTRRGRGDREFDRMINDVAYAVHADARSEEVTRRCLVTGLYQGGGISAWHFEQDGTWEESAQVDAYGQPVIGPEVVAENGTVTPGGPLGQTGEDGAPVKEFHATSQRVVNRFIPLSQAWLDPDGREHDFSEAKYVIIRYKRSLQDCWEDETFHKTGRRMLVHAVSEAHSSKLSSDKDGGIETDPAHINVEIAEIWDATTLQVIHVPVIGEQIRKFDLCAYAWPRALKQAKRLPFRLIAEDWNPPDGEDRDGIYPTPLFRHAKGLVEDIIRLYDLFFQAASKVVDKWVTYEGVLKSDSIVELMATDSDELVLLDPQGVSRAFGAGLQGNVPPPSQIVQRLDRGGEKLAQAMGFANMIQAAKQELFEIFGQGPADRGGVAPGATATEIVKMTAKLDQRVADAREEVSKAFDDGTEIAFLLIAENQTLPIPYQMTTSAYGEERWAEFEAEQLHGLDLIFNHVTDSSRPKNRALERLERKDFLATYMPFVDSKRQKDKLAMWAAEAHDTNGLALQDIFEDPAPEIAKQLLALQTAVQDKELEANDQEVASQLLELQTQLIEAVLSQADMEEVALGSANSGGGAARGAGKKSMTSGEMAAAGAAAGLSAVGG